MTRRSLNTLTLIALALAPVAMALPQGLADTAKKEQARRKKAAATSPTKVYTESDLPTAPAGATPSETEAPEDVKSSVVAADGERSARKDRERAMEAMRSAEAADFGMRIAGLKQRIAEVEARVKQLGNHPTGGGKVCKVAPGVFVPGVTAPELVVCPAQMESRYEVAKRTLETLKAELATVTESANRAGFVR